MARAMNTVDRPTRQDGWLQQAANQINILQSMVECEVSGDARRAFFLRDVEDAVWCAMKSARPGEAHMVRVAWRDRMNNHIRQAEVEFQSLGVVWSLDDLAVIWKKLRAVASSSARRSAKASIWKRSIACLLARRKAMPMIPHEAVREEAVNEISAIWDRLVADVPLNGEKPE